MQSQRREAHVLQVQLLPIQGEKGLLTHWPLVPGCLLWLQLLTGSTTHLHLHREDLVPEDAPFIFRVLFSSVQFSSVTQSCRTLWDPMDCSRPGLLVHQKLLELIQTHVHSVGDAILCLSLLLLPSIFPSITVFSNESVVRIGWPKYWRFSFYISPSNDYSGLISFRMDRLDILAVQGTLKSLLQHHSSKASILRCSAFFTVQLSHP